MFKDVEDEVFRSVKFVGKMLAKKISYDSAIMEFNFVRKWVMENNTVRCELDLSIDSQRQAKKRRIVEFLYRI